MPLPLNMTPLRADGPLPPDFVLDAACTGGGVYEDVQRKKKGCVHPIAASSCYRVVVLATEAGLKGHAQRLHCRFKRVDWSVAQRHHGMCPVTA